MEDALISPIGFMILSGAGLIEAKKGQTIKQHMTEQTNDVVVSGGKVQIGLANKPYTNENEGNYDLSYIYVMALDSNGEVVSEPYIPIKVATKTEEGVQGKYVLTLDNETDANPTSMDNAENDNLKDGEKDLFTTGGAVLVDYYVEHESGAQQIDITPDKFGGNYYLEASTLFRDTNGVDMPAEFIVPNCKIQSNFTFTMASSGDPSGQMRLAA